VLVIALALHCWSGQWDRWAVGSRVLRGVEELDVGGRGEGGEHIYIYIYIYIYVYVRKKECESIPNIIQIGFQFLSKHSKIESQACPGMKPPKCTFPGMRFLPLGHDLNGITMRFWSTLDFKGVSKSVVFVRN
jgi:hypothetical protein